MATGYTSEIANGISFEKFVLQCARAFGALISMRDDPWDAEIPNEFVPSDYHKNEMLAREEELGSLMSMPEEWANEQAAMQYEKEWLAYNKHLINVANIKDKYLSMLIKVKAWQPPTVDHNELKEFMIKQIVDSINWDCDISHVESPVLLDGKTWLAERIDSCSWDINYHAKEYQKEVEGCSGRTKWVQELKKSLCV